MNYKTIGNNVEVSNNGKKIKFIDTQHIYTLDLSKGTITKKEEADRTGIEVGDFVEYDPNNGVTYSKYLKSDYTGYSSNQSIAQQYKIWRVLNKNSDGTLDLIPAFKDTGVRYKAIYFSNAKGYNNGIYILDDICKTLYEKTNSDTDKAISARSLDYEDVTKLLVQNEDGKGIKKLDNDKAIQVGELEENVDNVIGKSGNKITYKTNTWYPVLYPNLSNENDPFYKNVTEFEQNATSNGKVTTKPDSLEVEYTSYFGETMNPTDFIDYDSTTEKSKKHEAIFGTGTDYILASRCVECNSSLETMFAL